MKPLHGFPDHRGKPRDSQRKNNTASPWQKTRHRGETRRHAAFSSAPSHRRAATQKPSEQHQMPPSMIKTNIPTPSRVVPKHLRGRGGPEHRRVHQCQAMKPPPKRPPEPARLRSNNVRRRQQVTNNNSKAPLCRSSLNCRLASAATRHFNTWCIRTPSHRPEAQSLT